jgi:glycosyltransferase involved in cell wall biosynthesis
MIKVHYHSDCPFFAGCENMLTNFFNSEKFRKNHDVSFSYRYSVKYSQGLTLRLTNQLPVYPLVFLNFPESSFFDSRLLNKLAILTLRLLLILPEFFYQIFILFRLFRKIKPDILHINNGGYPGALSARAAVVAAKLSGVPKVLMVVNNLTLNYKRFSRILDFPLDILVGKLTDLFITGSQVASLKLIGVLKVSSMKVKAVHNGISLRKISCSKETTRQRLGLQNFNGVIFGVVALLVERKGHQVLLDAIKNIVEDGRVPDDGFKVLIEGEGPLLKDLSDFVNKNELNGWIRFVGVEANIVDFISILDVLLLPSIRDEDFPNVIIEAMALAKPVIASRLAGTPEQVADGVTGILVDPNKPRELGDAICCLVAHPVKRLEMGKSGLIRFKAKFTCQRALDNYSDIYTRLLEIKNG